MRIILNKSYKIFFLSSIISLMFFSAVGADTGQIACTTAEAGNLKSVVVFVNGISNSVDDAENSRRLLESRLDSFCKRTSCVVQKFYNKTDGFFDDTNELNFVGELERDSANNAFFDLVGQVFKGYEQYKSYLVINQSALDIKSFNTVDTEIVLELHKLLIKSWSSASDTSIEFSEAGSNITDWLINKLLSSVSIQSIENSIFLTSMKENEAYYDAKFKVNYQSALTTYYLSNRNFYGNDYKANVAVTRTVEGLVSYLEELMLSGKKIVVVAHSQGNHMIELAYGILEKKWGTSVLRSIQVVGVASVASTTPSNTYITWDDDHTVLFTYDNTSDGDPLVGNFSVMDDSPSDGTNDHSFIDVYMNHNLAGRYNPNGRGNLSGIQAFLNDEVNHPIDEWITGLVKGSIDVAVPYSNNIISSGFVTATLRWEKYGDMDLWTNENNENIVSYQNKIGIYDGGLDRDDTDGEGPEHYTANIDCKAAENKSWDFGIHQYPSGNSSAIAHFSIKVGNIINLQKSYSLEKWPSQIQWIGNITFGSLDGDSKLPYTITINDSILPYSTSTNIY